MKKIFLAASFMLLSLFINAQEIRELADNVECMKTFIGHSDYVTSVSYSPDGKYVASGSWDKTVKIWEVSSGKCIRSLEGHSDYVTSVSYSPDGKYVASGGADETVKVWEISSGKCIKNLIGHSYMITNVSYSPDGKYVASGNVDETVKVWEISSGKCIKTLTEQSEWVSGISYSPDRKYLATSGMKDTVKIWELSIAKCIRTLIGHSDYVTGVSYSPDGRYLASGSRDKTVKIWEVQSIYIKSRVTEQADVMNVNRNVIGVIPADTICMAIKKNGKIIEPIKGYINNSKIEELEVVSGDKRLNIKKLAPVYSDAEMTKQIETFNAGKIFEIAYFSKKLNKYYIEENSVKGWLRSEDVEEISKKNEIVAVFNNNTKSYDYINGNIKNSYNSGEVLQPEWYSESGYYYSDSIGWISKESVKIIYNSNKVNKIFIVSDTALFENDLTGENYKKVKRGTEFETVGETSSYYLLKNKNSLEKGWIKKEYLSQIKPDLNAIEAAILNASSEESTSW
ncbi:MAG: translocation protein TolB [bacterium ADurb.Bin363]|nr:MAG: translocation protein TolB [bacterium ADurb.Bin363]